MISAKQFVQQAFNGNYIGIPYEQLDCQAFVERVLRDCGENHDWRGSNHMWRDALSIKAVISNEMAIPAGALLFTLKYDGGEKERGYNDSEGNATHVGIYLGLSRVIHSTTGGVQWDDISRSRWTHYGLCKYVDYSQPAIDDEAHNEYYAQRNKINVKENSETNQEKNPSSSLKQRVVKFINVSDLTDEEISDLLNGVSNPWNK